MKALTLPMIAAAMFFGFAANGNADEASGSKREILKALKAEVVKGDDAAQLRRSAIVVKFDRTVRVVTTPANRTAASRTEDVPVIVDGVLTRLPKWVLEANLRNGFFKLVSGRDRLIDFDVEVPTIPPIR